MEQAEQGSSVPKCLDSEINFMFAWKMVLLLPVDTSSLCQKELGNGVLKDDTRSLIKQADKHMASNLQNCVQTGILEF